MVGKTNEIAKNTFFLYIRSFLTMGIGLYSSRLLLSTLGVQDFGLYNIVGGVVAMFASLKVVFAGSVQRFLSFEKGKGNSGDPQTVFNISLVIHAILATLFFLIVEIVGIQFLIPSLSLPEGSYNTALFVFQCSLLTAIVSILNTPFDAVIIANERIKFFAWVTLIESCLRCTVIMVLPLFAIRYVKTYAIAILIITLSITITNILYSRQFEECKYKKFNDRMLIKDLLSFSGWNFLGNTSFTLVNEGLNFLLNVFGGVAVNAARGLAYQVMGAVGTLNNNLFVAVKPVLMQQAAFQDKEILYEKISLISRFSFAAIVLTSYPIIVFSQDLLNIWLKEVPNNASLFIQILLVYSIIRSLHNPLELIFFSIGNIKVYQIIDAISYALSIPLSFICLKIGAPLWIVFAIMCIVAIINIGCVLICAKRVAEFKIKKYLHDVVIFTFKIVFPLIIIWYFTINYFYNSSFLLLLCEILAILASEFGIVYCAMPKGDRHIIINILNKRLLKNE